MVLHVNVHAQAWGIPLLTLLSQMSHGHVPGLSPSALAFLPVATLSGLPSVIPTFAQLVGVSGARHVHSDNRVTSNHGKAHISRKETVHLSQQLDVK